MEGFILMIETLKTYIKQRFDIKIFGLLTVYLFIYAKGSWEFTLHDIYALPFLLLLVFYFRLFDDLQHKDSDKPKSNRNYTKKADAEQLSKVSIAIIMYLLVMLLFVDFNLAKYSILFLFLNRAAYWLLLENTTFSNYLPFLKYPFYCLALAYYFNFGNPLDYLNIIFALLLFPAFLIVEKLTDSNKKWFAYGMLILLFIIRLLKNYAF